MSRIHVTGTGRGLAAGAIVALAGCAAPPEPAPRAVSSTAPTPYTAAEIREGNPPGTRVLHRVERDGAPVTLMETRFGERDEDRVLIEARTYTEDGEPIGAPRWSEATWTALRDHAAFPAARTRREPAACTVEAGRFEGWLYVVDGEAEGGAPTTSRFWFAGSRPGPPVLFEIEREGRVTYRMELVEFGRERAGASARSDPGADRDPLSAR